MRKPINQFKIDSVNKRVEVMPADRRKGATEMRVEKRSIIIERAIKKQSTELHLCIHPHKPQKGHLQGRNSEQLQPFILSYPITKNPIQTIKQLKLYPTSTPIPPKQSP